MIYIGSNFHSNDMTIIGGEDIVKERENVRQ